MVQKGPSDRTTVASNRRARANYDILDTYECGLVLKGSEVKSLRDGAVQLGDAYARVRSNEMWLMGLRISPWGHSSAHNGHVVDRPRKLLLHRHELDRLTGSVERKGYTLVPLDLHWHKGRAKLAIGLGRGKKQHDKRADRKDRDWQRQKERILKH